jgi:hypothetical protein
VTDRAAALRSLRTSRTDGLPPPPPVASGGGATASSRPSPPEEPRRQLSDVSRQEASGDTGHPHETTSLDALLADPVRACREMGNLRENMPARPLNVDLTPDVAAAFDQQCRTLRVKKKDVVELLLRGWLQHQGRDLS